MRLLLAGFLMTSLLLIGVSTYESTQAPAEPGAGCTPSRSEDGTGFPQPYPTPKP
jgi:hypothetical protein